MKASIALLACLIGIRAGWAQPITANSRPVVDVDDRMLQEKYHIPPTTAGFLTALHHERSDVRSFAALRLAAEGQKDAIPAILAALSAETFPGAKINLATAAAELGAPEGISALEDMCQDPNWHPTLRMVAAQSLLGNVHRGGCLLGVLATLRSPDDPQASAMALNLLPRFTNIEPRELDEVKTIAATYLRSSILYLRMAASHLIREIGGAWPASQLREALEIESDEAVRKVMAKDLSSMRQ